MNSAYKYPHARILLFCKAPVVGEVKTRLIPALGAEGACELHTRLLQHITATLAEAMLCPSQFWVSPDAEHEFFNRYKANQQVTLRTQQGDDLGQRMLFAAEAALSGSAAGSGEEAEYVLLIGSDCPAVTADYLEAALAKLASGSQAVIGPAADGGYVLLGLRQADVSLFEDMAWGTDAVAEETCRRMNKLAWLWSRLDTLWDVDVPADLEKLEGMTLRRQGS